MDTKEINVLHVDDEPTLSELVAEMLQRDNSRFTVDTATSASEGLDRVAADDYNCIISDYNMPGMDGLEFLQTVREEYPDLPFILFTGKGSEAVASDAIAADATDYLQKSSGSEQYELLANRIRNAVQARREVQRADRQEELIRLTEFAGNTGGFELDRESGTILLTGGTRRIIGRPDQTEAPVEETIELFHPDDRGDLRQALDRAFETGGELHDTWRLQPGDGDERLLDITITQVVESGGEVTKLRGAVNDITDRKERQRELKQIETLFQHAQDSLFLIDVAEEYTIERVNPAWEDETGVSAEQVRGQTPRAVLGEQPGANAETKYNECIQRQEPLQYEETLRFDGECSYWITQIAPVVVDGTVEYLVGSTRNVTQQKERQQELALFFERSPLGAVQWDDKFRFERLNARAEEILGYDEPELRGEPWETIVVADDHDKVGTVVENLLDADGGEHALNRNVRKDDEVLTGEWHNRVITDAEGEVQSIFSKFQDVTERENRKRELEEYETIIEALTDAVYVVDEEGRFTYVNDELVELVGYDRETIIGSLPALIKDEEAVQRAEQELGRLLSSDGPETVTFEVTIHPQEGDPIDCEDHMGVLPYDGDQFSGSVGTLRDITEQKEREARLRETTKQVQGVIDTVESAMWIRNADTEYVYMNQHHRDLFDIADDTDIAGKQVTDLHSVEVAEHFQHNDQRVYETNEPVEIEETVETDDGPRNFLTRIVPLFENGSVYATCGIATDITGQKEHEQKLQTQKERLEEFASIVSHDLRNPLQVADGRLELMREECESDHIDGVAQALDRMGTLIEDLLTLAGEGEQIDETESVGLADVAKNSWQTVNTEQAALETHTSRAVEADQSRLRQLLENLYRNAVEHGGDDVTVSVGAMDDGFYVADTGPGIPEGDREEVFEAGYSTNEDGTGFGLRIVEQIADAHGWEIAVTESEEGGGRFEITGVESVNC